MRLLITPVMVLWKSGIDNKYVPEWSTPYLDNTGIRILAVNLGITRALGIPSDLLENYSRDFGTEKMSLTEAPRH